MFTVLKRDPNSRARTGLLETPHGIVETPSYVPVGTHGTIRTLENWEIPQTRTQVIIANTYHLWQTVGEEALEYFPGIHQYMGWDGPVMTDSGGFQVFSLGFVNHYGVKKVLQIDERHVDEIPRRVRITEAGVYFHPTDTDGVSGGDAQYLDPELSIKLQEQIGADIILAFDEPNAPYQDHAYTAESVARTTRWAQRCLDARTSAQMLYGIVQGGYFEDLRTASAQELAKMPFDGYAIGGFWGTTHAAGKTHGFKELAWSTPFLPDDKPRHLLGIGMIEDLFYGIEQGIDTFDCVIPTREARHGRIWTARGRFNILKSDYRGDDTPLDPTCGCPTCTSNATTRGYLRELFKEKNLEAGRRATIHNLYFFNTLMTQIRTAISEGKFTELKKRTLDTLSDSSGEIL